MSSLTSPFESTYNKLNCMEEQREVDLSILTDLSALEDRFAKEEEYWKSSESPIVASFTMFHSLRNCRMVLRKMALRFQSAKKVHQNPQIVYSARLVLPRINDLYDMIEPLKGQELTANVTELVKQRLRLLRDIAESTSMLPSVSEEAMGVPRFELKRRFSELATDLQAKISEE